MTARGLALELPNGQTLLRPVDISFEAKTHILLRGPSGSGKSTLFRALAGIWPWGRGEVTVPRGARLMFLPQKPYLPIGVLRSSLTYPADGESVALDRIVEAMAACRLAHLSERLEERANWQHILSPGEQQRLSAARALLSKPDWLFLDEATSAVDDETELALYRLFLARLPETNLVSIAHRPAVTPFHDRILTLTPQGDGTACLL